MKNTIDEHIFSNTMVKEANIYVSNEYVPVCWNLKRKTLWNQNFEGIT